MSISQATIEDVKSRIDIIDVIGDFVTLKRTGQHFKAKSPFTDEKTPSFIVFPRNQNFKDFSSGKQGDAITFLMEYDGLSYLDAIKYLAKKYGVEIEEAERSPEDIQKQNEKESLLIILNFAKDYFKDLLWVSDEGKSIGLSYFKERGFGEDIIKKFELGYSLDQWNKLENDAKSKGYSVDQLEKAGLIIKKEEQQYDRFRGRVIFPIHSITGKTIAFGARILKNVKNQPKYINSPETEVYHKSDVLYGLYQASRSIRLLDNCYLVEGYTDVISLHQFGVENVVASSGTSLTENQIKLIHRHTSNITVLFDGDAAGIRASLRGIDMILEQGMNVKVVAFPDGEDPDSYSKKLGRMEFKEFLQTGAEDFIHFKTKLLIDGGENDPIKKAETISHIIGSLSIIPDQVKRAVYIKETSNLLNLDEQILYAELNKILLNRRKEKQRKNFEAQPEVLIEQIEEEHQKESLDPVVFQEQEAIRILIKNGFYQIENKHNLVKHYIDELDPIEFSNPVYNEILNIFKEELNKGNVVDSNFFINHQNPEIRNEVYNLISERHEISENWERYRIYVPREKDVIVDSVYSNILRYKFRKMKKLIDINLEELKNETDVNKQTEKQEIHVELTNAASEYSNLLGIVVS